MKPNDGKQADLVDAIEENMCRFRCALALGSGATVFNEAGRCWIINPNRPHSAFNGVLQTRIEPNELDAGIEAALAPFRSRDIRAAWWVGPKSEPRELGPRLLSHGMALGADMPAMAADLNKLNEALPAPRNLRVVRVRSCDALEQYVNLFSTFGLPECVNQAQYAAYAELSLRKRRPDWQRYLGYLDDTPVGFADLYLAAGVAGIYSVGTLEPFRHQGVGTALTLSALLDARELGYGVGVLESSAMGESVYHGLGFQDVCRVCYYLDRENAA